MLVDFARDHAEMIHTIETYELRGESEVARPEFSLYGPDEHTAEISRAARIELAAEQVARILAVAKAEGLVLGFQVWI
jgi:hypothetical protein